MVTVMLTETGCESSDVDVHYWSSGEVSTIVQKSCVQKTRSMRAKMDNFKLRIRRSRIAVFLRPEKWSCPPEAARERSSSSRRTRLQTTFSNTKAVDAHKGSKTKEENAVTVAAKLLESAANSWDIDAFALARATSNRPLSVLGMFLFNRLGLVETFSLDRKKLFDFLTEIERGYDDCHAYHNRAHAASVLHCMYALLEHGGLMKVLVSTPLGNEDIVRTAQLQRMACLLAAAAHDFEHMGLTNDFLVKTGHERAVQFNNENVNEQHHVSAAFDLLLRPELNFLEHLPAHELRTLRSLVSDLVLSTDMAEHQSICRAASEVLSEATLDSRPMLGREEEKLLLELAIKCADLSHAAFSWDLHLQWVSCLEAEFFLQGDKEKEAGLPVSRLMDRAQPGPSEGQVGFYQGIVLPLFTLLAKAAPDCRPLLEAAEKNCSRWKDLEAASRRG